MYRYADVVGVELFVAGQVPLDANGDLVASGDPAGQTKQCLDNLHTLVATHSFALSDVRHLTIYVVGEHQNLLDAWDAMTTWWNNQVPPATLLGVNNLGYGTQLVEIDARVVRSS
jgi:enamine deaminase RidA (YjgF/YER057c/UK114 family)